MDTYSCVDCEHARFCETWAEWKCVVKEMRVCFIDERHTCELHAKNKKGFKERPCQCEDCLKNDKLLDEVEI